jgi:hypothetical protein
MRELADHELDEVSGAMLLVLPYHHNTFAEFGFVGGMGFPPPDSKGQLFRLVGGELVPAPGNQQPTLAQVQKWDQHLA